MSVSFLRIDDRMIHGQTVTRWSLEYPCDGLIAVNDKAAANKTLKMAYKSSHYLSHNPPDTPATRANSQRI